MSLLHLVRHGKSAPDAGRPNHEWELAADAGERLSALRDSGVLPNHARWFSSPEPKALGTARALTESSIGIVDGLREMVRPAGPWRGADEWAALVRASMTELDTPALSGWETGRTTIERVTRAVNRIREVCPGEQIVLCGHATAWTLLLAALVGRAPDFEAWQRIRMPDHCVVEFSGDTVSVVTPWGSWTDDERSEQ